jgi:hypothetical protein
LLDQSGKLGIVIEQPPAVQGLGRQGGVAGSGTLGADRRAVEQPATGIASIMMATTRRRVCKPSPCAVPETTMTGRPQSSKSLAD